MGAPYELTSGKRNLRTATPQEVLNVDKQHSVNIMYKGYTTFSSGSVTDDTEMLIALYRALYSANGWNRDIVLKSYLHWANSKNPSMGRNTRALLKGVKTIKGYENRMAGSNSYQSESNGCLMRLPALGLYCLQNNIHLNIALQWTTNDVYLTNPNEVCNSHCRAYITAVYAIHNSEVKDKPKSGIDTLMSISPRLDMDITQNEGWIRNAYQCCVYALQLLHNNTDIKQIYTDIIMKGGDTDTNMCIVGALIGLCGIPEGYIEQQFSVALSKIRSAPARHSNYSINYLI
jgi:ADP-ribosylglycohydrolase